MFILYYAILFTVKLTNMSLFTAHVLFLFLFSSRLVSLQEMHYTSHQCLFLSVSFTILQNPALHCLPVTYTHTDFLKCRHLCSVTFSKLLFFCISLFSLAPEASCSEHVLMRRCYRGQHDFCLFFVTGLWGTSCARGNKTPSLKKKKDMCNVFHVKISPTLV